MQKTISNWAHTFPRLNLDIESPVSSMGGFEERDRSVNEANGETLDKHGFDYSGNPNGTDLNERWSEEFWRDDA